MEPAALIVIPVVWGIAQLIYIKLNHHINSGPKGTEGAKEAALALVNRKKLENSQTAEEDEVEEDDDEPELDFALKEKYRKEPHDEWDKEFLALLPPEEHPDYVEPSVHDEEGDTYTQKSAWGQVIVTSDSGWTTPDGKRYWVETHGYPEKHTISHRSYREDITEKWNKLTEQRKIVLKTDENYELKEQLRLADSRIKELTERFEEVSSGDPDYGTVLEMCDIADEVGQLTEAKELIGSKIEVRSINATMITADSISGDGLYKSSGFLAAPKETQYVIPATTYVIPATTPEKEIPSWKFRRNEY